MMTQDYFQQARSWSDDISAVIVTSRNRYKLAFILAMTLCIILTIGVIGLVPLQRLQPILIHHYQDGHVTVEPIKQPLAPPNPALIESEIVHYIINRETYDPASYKEQYSIVSLMSNEEIAHEYMQEQSAGNENSPISIFGNRSYRTVHIENVIFLDRVITEAHTQKNQHKNLAQVSFMVTDHDRTARTQHSISLTALVSWSYSGIPKDPELMWKNWDGFTVTHYRVTQRIVQARKD
jgi:type IV secretion system protein VirB8